MSETTEGTTRAARKTRPEIQIYRPGMLRNAGSTKSIATNEERPPRPEKLSTARRQSNDTDITSRAGSGSTTPDANAINEKGRNRFDSRGQGGSGSSYNSTQSLYDTRRQGGYMEYNGGGNRSNRNGGGGRNYNQQHQQHRQPFERPGNYSRGFSERASMRGDGAIARRPQGSSRRQRNDSINSTQSEMPQSNKQLHIDTSFESASQCGASSTFSMNSLGEAFSFEEMCQNMQNFASMDWSKEVEDEFIMQMQLEEQQEEERQRKLEQERAEQEEAKSKKNNRKNRRANRRDESDRESSFGGSIAEEEEENEQEELKSGERTPTSERSHSFNPRVLYQRTRGANDENAGNGARRAQKKEPRRYRGEHDDRDDDTTEYNGLEHHMSSGRLAGRISIVPRSQNGGEDHRSRQRPEETSKPSQKRSQNQSEMASREQINRRRQEEIDRNEEIKIREISEKIEKLSGAVKKRDLKSAEKMSKLSLELADLYSTVIFPDIIYSFTVGLEQKLFRQAFYKSIESLRSGSNSASPDARLIRAATQKLLLNGILFYETLISTYQSEFHVDLQEALTWPSGFPTDEELMDDAGVPVPVGIQKYESATQKTALKSLSRHLISLGDLHRYKSLIDGSENYETSKSFYQKSSQLWPSTGHPFNQLSIVTYYSMLYRSARRARLIPVDVLSRQRQKRVIDEFFYLTRALSCSHPYEASRDRLKQRLDAIRAKVAKYQPVLDKECGILKAQGKALRKLQFIRQIWIHPTKKTTENGTGEKIIDDVLSNFLEQSKSKLHRRAVSYLCDTFGMLVTKIGMEHFKSVSERSFGLLYASLHKSETDFSAEQLIKLSTMFIYAVHLNYEKADSQLEISLNSLLTFYSILLQNLKTHRSMEIPALNVISTWILSPQAQEILEKVGGAYELLPNTITPAFPGFSEFFDEFSQIDEKIDENWSKNYPEIVLLSSFFKIFDAQPGAADECRSSRISRALRFLEEKLTRKMENSAENEPEEEEPRSREQLIEAERGKGTTAIVIHPEYLVPDTNVFIGELQLVQDLVESNGKFQILIPTTVLDELIYLSKSSPTDPKTADSHDPERSSKAKLAVGWLREQAKLKNRSSLFTLTTTGKRLPSLNIATEGLEETAKLTNDDQILNSALKWSESLPEPSQNSLIQQVASSVTSSETVILRTCILLTGDRGLTIKAIGSQLPCRGIASFCNWID